MTGRKAGFSVCVVSSSVLFVKNFDVKCPLESTGEKYYFAARWVLSDLS